MIAVDISIQEPHLDVIKKLVLSSDAREGAAYVLFSESRITQDPWDSAPRRRFLTYATEAIPSQDIISIAPDHVSWSTDSFVQLLKRAKDEKLVPGIVHSHPSGPARFSSQDRHNESQLAEMARNRNGAETPLLSLLINGKGDLCAQAWFGDDEPSLVSLIRVVGERLRVHTATNPPAMQEAFARQTIAFGDDLQRQLGALTIGVVGCGGTGSAVALMLARLGVGRIVLIDRDIVELTNLNRLHGATRADADAGRLKVEVIEREINRIGLETQVATLSEWVGSLSCRDALKSCDVLFGCTDDHDGRIFLNRFAYFYLVPVIDVGLAIEPHVESGRVQELSGRCTVLAPGGSCLLCREIADTSLAREEDLSRNNPCLYAKQKEEAYVRGSGNPAPSVVTFTTATAAMAIDELLQGISGFRGGDGWARQRIRRFDLMRDRMPGALVNKECPICADKTYWGLGDIEPFLDRIG